MAGQIAVILRFPPAVVTVFDASEMFDEPPPYVSVVPSMLLRTTDLGTPPAMVELINPSGVSATTKTTVACAVIDPPEARVAVGASAVPSASELFPFKITRSSAIITARRTDSTVRHP